MQVIAVGMAAFLTAVDTVYVAQRRIPPIYLAAAAAEAALIAAWGAAWASQESKTVKAAQQVASGRPFAHA